MSLISYEVIGESTGSVVCGEGDKVHMYMVVMVWYVCACGVAPTTYLLQSIMDPFVISSDNAERLGMSLYQHCHMT